jgi:CxxC motif-containing protein (DUF1111 family)
LFAAVAALGLGSVASCGDLGTDVSAVEGAALGDQLAGIASAEFSAARANFAAFEGIADGLGPVFNERACGACHTDGAQGGAGVQIERRYGRFVNGLFDPLGGSGGSLRQLFSLGNFNNPSFHGGPAGNPTLCQVPVEVEPAAATVHNVGRLVTPVFGLGLVDAMPDSFFDGLAAAELAGVRGTVRRTTVLLPMIRFDAGAETGVAQQAVGSTRVARFGWKANVPTLQQFAADAYLNEMGITTQSCIGGTSNVSFATESAPNGIPEPLGCDDLAPAAPAGVPPGTDDSVGSCAGGLTEVQEDIANFAKFMTFLAPTARDNSNAIAVAAGQPLFTSAGCAGCHTTTTFRTPATTPNGVPANFAFNPFSDFLIHDMGSLGDQIGVNAGETLAQTRQMRTAPLWGIRFRNKLLHDGRVSDVASAIRAHDGQGAAAAAAFNTLNGAQQSNLVAFVRSL